MISYDEFKKIEVRIGEILTAERVPETDKLVRLTVNLGEEKPRQIVSGIALYFPDVATLVGRKCPFVTNLEPRVIKGLESQGMIMAISNAEGAFSLLEPSGNAKAGDIVV